MKRESLLLIFAVASAFLFAACNDDGVKETASDDFDVRFVLPDYIYADGENGVTFTVIDGKAPLLSDTFLLEPVEQDGDFTYSYLCSIIETSSESFTVEISDLLATGQYNIYIMRGVGKKPYGSSYLYHTVDTPLKILFIGNSFTVDAVNHLPGIVAAAGLKNVKMVDMFYGGRTLPEHYSNYMTTSDYTCYTCLPGATSWTTTSNTSLHDVVMSDTWDIVTLQEYTGTYYAWEWTEDEKTVIEGLIEYIKEDQGDNVPKIGYIMSQAFFNLNAIPSSSKSHMAFETTQEMFYVIAEQGKRILEETAVEEIIPTGTMLENLRTTSLNNDVGLTRGNGSDGYHMDYGISRYGAACTVFEMLISPKYGIYLDDNTYRYSSNGVAVTDETKPIALKAARNAIENPFEITDMSDY